MCRVLTLKMLILDACYLKCVFLLEISCVDRKSSDLGLGGMRREYLQTDCAINAVIPSYTIWVVPVRALLYMCSWVMST